MTYWRCPFECGFVVDCSGEDVVEIAGDHLEYAHGVLDDDDDATETDGKAGA